MYRKVDLSRKPAVRRRLRSSIASAAMCLSAATAVAAPMGTATLLGEVDTATLEVCLLQTFVSADYDVFGHNVNLGTQAVSAFCHGLADQPMSCVSSAS